MILPGVDADQRDTIEAAITDGRLAGIRADPLPLIAVSEATGVSFISPATADVVASVGFDAPARGMAKVTGIDKPTLYVALGDDRRRADPARRGGRQDAAPPRHDRRDARRRPTGDLRRADRDGPRPGQRPGWLGRHDLRDRAPRQRGLCRCSPAVRRRGLGLDANGDYPSDDRQSILVASAGGSLATVDIGNHAFAWRLPGVLAGALMAGLIFLLVRILFRRREVAVIAAILVLVDGMLFVQSRIGMNDVYVGLFIVAAYTLFAPLWTGRWRSPWAFWVALPIDRRPARPGASPRSGSRLYAIGGIALLILGRSALGRIALILGAGPRDGGPRLHGDRRPGRRRRRAGRTTCSWRS